MIKASLNVSLINKDRLFQGKKGKYLNIVLIETPNSEYGDYLITEDVTREDRQAGKKGTILGNGKIFGRAVKEEAPARAKPNDDEEIPF